jgi:hypothetical protein
MRSTYYPRVCISQVLTKQVPLYVDELGNSVSCHHGERLCSMLAKFRADQIELHIYSVRIYVVSIKPLMYVHNTYLSLLYVCCV